ncbi:MAG: transporter substrate-binding domain-containing protein [Deltaproteobacteria bacterium]|nr:transporter substrate-binding domain-containing protein [Deltaproteobacteria bacterium]
MKKFYLAMALLLGLALAAPQAQAGAVIQRILKQKELVVATTGDYPPLTAKTKEGKFIGLDMDLVKALAQSLGVRLKVRQMPFERLVPAAASGEVDLAIGGISVTPRRNAKVYFAGPYFISGQTLLATSKVGEGIKGLDDVNQPGFSIAVAKGTTSEQAARQIMRKAKIVAADTLEQALDMVLNGQVKAMVADYPYCAVAVFRNPEAKLGTLQKPFTFEPLGIALPPSDPQWDNLVTNFLFNMEGGGRLGFLKNRWFKSPAWMRLLPE